MSIDHNISHQSATKTAVVVSSCTRLRVKLGWR
jgi:hypothetical protein